MAFWLIKSEPSSYSWDDLVRDGKTEWDGVRNNAARLHLRTMKAGDRAFFYRSLVEPAVVGMVEVSRGPAPDPKDNAWVSVEVTPIEPVGPVTLKAIKAEVALTDMILLRQSRLSVAPVRKEEWDRILALGHKA
ncbi:MAG: EVE domain-containing protein [Sphingomonas sp.]|nr:EVE domain-containing protein [Sphingomonas sp.]